MSEFRETGVVPDSTGKKLGTESRGTGRSLALLHQYLSQMGLFSGRISLNGVAPYPLRLTEVEDLIQGMPADDDTGIAAGELATRGFRPLRHNDFKVPLTRSLVRRAVRGDAV